MFCLKGEDRSFGGNDLFVDLIPSTSFFRNVRSCVRNCDWDILRKKVYERVDNKCECCHYNPANKEALNGSLEAHERWSYNKSTGVQKLMRLIALCKKCHLATHIGLADLRGLGDMARLHLMKVNDMGEKDVKEHCERASRIWSERSDQDWALDLSIITDSGFRLKETKKVKNVKDIKDAKENIEELIVSDAKSVMHNEEMNERSAHCIGKYRNSNNQMIYRIDLSVNRHLDESTGQWWLRKFRDPNDTLPGDSDKRMPSISANKKLHISCRLDKGRYMLGCGDIYGISIVQCFTVHKNGQIEFE
jgi:hypothetical protein